MLNDDIQFMELRAYWLAEAYAEAQEQNPLRGYCERVYIVRTSCKRRRGPKKGKPRSYSSHEVELLRFLPSRRCVQMSDIRTPGLVDALAEEIFSGKSIPPHTTPAQLFLDYFRRL